MSIAKPSASVGALAATSAGAVAILLLMFSKTFVYLWGIWQQAEYSHGMLIPLVSGLLLWQRRDLLRREPLEGSWYGLAIVVLGLCVYFVGAIASITTVDTYALVTVLCGLALAVMGWRAFRVALPPLLLLFLMNPIPSFLFNNLSSTLQLLSSQIGVAVIRLFGISVFLEGNVIDLGSYKLQVVEACSGLRYLFPLLTLGVAVVSMLRGPLWTRLLVVVSTIPITVLMNSFRIGVIGVLVDRFGISQAEGFLHDFEGWIIFMTCFAILLLETWGLFRIAGDKRAFRDLFMLSRLPVPAGGPQAVPRRVGGAALATLVVLALAAWPALALTERAEEHPPRLALTSFPMQVGEWRGYRERIETMYLELLKLDDYVMADYTSAGGPSVNFYVAYYASQRAGQSAHSPSSCLPGAGWRIVEFNEHEVQDIEVADHPLRVNRAVIQLGEQRQLVYYWFQQRGRTITNEYLVKWFLLWDALTKNRSDGALVRVITPLSAQEGIPAAEARLNGLLKQAAPLLASYVPD